MNETTKFNISPSFGRYKKPKMNYSDSSRQNLDYTIDSKREDNSVISGFEQQHGVVYNDGIIGQPSNQSQGLLEALEATSSTVLPTNHIIPQVSRDQHQHQHQYRPQRVPQLSSQLEQEIVPASNQPRDFELPTQSSQNSTSSNHNQLQRFSTQSSLKPRRTRKNKPGKKFGAKKRSWVWSWFKQDNRNPNLAVCNKCMRVIIRVTSDKGSPKKLIEHLKTHRITAGHRTTPIGENIGADHGQRSGEDEQARGTSYYVRTSNLERQCSQTERGNALSSGFAGPYTPPFISHVYSKRSFQHHLLAFLLENKLPVNIIRSESFQKAIGDLRPGAFADLQELIYFYDSCMQVSQFETDTQVFASAEESAILSLLANTLQ
ncbi:hypothetical protein CANMA_005339 [Candida margitis]|uniref:uncharacterized protein n=1 Tax=Candida margitis TaxID=1775924 RepID=UPI0022277727|nr:uncharacterized protein CANMA_005339 [Candida margitis]KAI5950411.1 hypothetical protein CANMA_005339 [Candida margitis]